MGTVLQQMSSSELIMASGIALIILAAVTGIISIVAFVCTGKKLKSKLEQEYGDNG